jgi:hypothetical protein
MAGPPCVRLQAERDAVDRYMNKSVNAAVAYTHRLPPQTASTEADIAAARILPHTRTRKLDRRNSSKRGTCQTTMPGPGRNRKIELIENACARAVAYTRRTKGLQKKA